RQLLAVLERQLEIVAPGGVLTLDPAQAFELGQVDPDRLLEQQGWDPAVFHAGQAVQRLRSDDLVDRLLLVGRRDLGGPTGQRRARLGVGETQAANALGAAALELERR